MKNNICKREIVPLLFLPSVAFRRGDRTFEVRSPSENKIGSPFFFASI